MNLQERIKRNNDLNESTYIAPICNQCKHFKLSNVSCTAYPNGIPDQILENLVDHTKPFIGDNGIQFEKK